MSDDFQFPEPGLEAEQTPAPLPRQRSPLVLPWGAAGVAVVALAVVALYAKKMIDDQTARAYQAMRMADEYGSRAAKLEADQKDARRQAITSSEKSDEARAANARLTEQVGDKDSALRVLRYSIENGFFSYPYFTSDPLLDSLRNEAEFQQLMTMAQKRHNAFRTAFF